MYSWCVCASYFKFSFCGLVLCFVGFLCVWLDINFSFVPSRIPEPALSCRLDVLHLNHRDLFMLVRSIRLSHIKIADFISGCSSEGFKVFSLSPFVLEVSLRISSTISAFSFILSHFFVSSETSLQPASPSLLVLSFQVSNQ